MNILASYNWIKEYLKTDLSPQEFASEFTRKSFPVERIDVLSERFANMVIGQVKELKPHSNADKLQLAMTDIGGEVVQIVCGGKNLKEGMKVLVTLPGSKVRWHGEGDLITLEEATIRGEKSFGMISAPEEVGFDKYPCNEGDIWDLGALTDAAPGTTLVEALDMDDVIFDIEVTTNRPDAMSILGLAREAGAAIDAPFEFTPPELPATGQGKDISVTVKESDLCPRYMAVVIDGIKVGPSPLWLQKKILHSGHRPINNIVDITNYILHEYGQPLHTFDYDKLRGGEVIVRRAKNGEHFLALDDNEYELNDSQLVIADKEGPVAIAGVMGGKHSGTWSETKTIVFEAATFDPVSVRKTARALNLYSDSQLLFEKGLSTEATAQALAKAVELTLELAGGEVVSEVKDVRAGEYAPLRFPFDPNKVRELLGVELETQKMIETLERLGFVVSGDSPELSVTVPFWRDHDIEAEIDFTEEIARMYGYHNLPSVLPQSPPPADPESVQLKWEDWTKQFLAAAGYTEFYGYSFVGQDTLKRYDIDPADALKLHNPLSSDLSHMRPSLVPSLLADIERNQGEVPSGRVFELARTYTPQVGELPQERTQLVLSEFGQENPEPAFLRIKGVLELFAKKTGLDITLERVTDDSYWHPSRAARLMLGDQRIGSIGQVASAYQSAFGIDRPVIAAVVDFERIAPQMREARRFEDIPEFPAITRDIAVIVDEVVEFAQLEEKISQQSPIIESVELFDIYRGTGVPDGQKSVALRITLRAPDRTLSSEHADDVMKVAVDVLKSQFNAIMR